MKIFAGLLISFLLFSGITTDQVRLSFKKARNSEEAAMAFNELMQKEMNINVNLKNAYLGASEIMLADYGSNIPQKIKLFKAGRDKLEVAVLAEPKSFEIRLIRLIIQKKTPDFLRYKSNIEEDKKFILDNYADVVTNANSPKSLKHFVEDMNKDLNIFSPEEMNQRK